MGDGWRLGPYRALSHRFVVEGVDAERVRLRLEHALAPLGATYHRLPGRGGSSELVPPPLTKSRGTPTYRVEHAAKSGKNLYRVRFGRKVIGTGSAFYTAGLVLWHVNQRAVAKDNGRHLLLHAAAAERDGLLVVILGQSGYGKTTTVTGLLHSGYRYLTDEAVSLDRHTFGTRPFPKALAINADVFPLRGSATASHDPTRSDVVRHARWWDMGSPGVAGTGTTPGLIVVLRPRGDDDKDRVLAPGSSRRLSPGQAAVEIADSTFEFPDRVSTNLDAAARLACSVPCYELVRADVAAMCAEIDSLVATAGCLPVGERVPAKSSRVTAGAVEQRRSRAAHGPIRSETIQQEEPQEGPQEGPQEEETAVTEVRTHIDPMGAYVPTAGLTAVKVDTETLIHHPETEQLHRLDPTASAIWELLDGTVTLDQLVDEVAEVYATPVDVVRADLYALVTRLLESRLITDIHHQADRPVGEAAPLGGQQPLIDTGTDPRIVRVPPSRCYDAAARLDWIGTDAIQVGHVVVGVRTDCSSTRTAVRAALSPWLADGFDVDANFSVRGPSESMPGAPWAPAQVLAGCTWIGKHRDLSSAIGQLIAEIGWLAAREAGAPPASILRATTGALVSAEGPPAAVLVPPGLARNWPVTRGKVRVAAASGVFLDLRAGHILIPSGTGGVWALPPVAGVGAFDPHSAGWTRVPVVGWLLPRRRQPSETEMAADRVLAALSQMSPPSGTKGEAVASLTALAAEGAVALSWDPGSLADAQRLIDRWLHSGPEPPPRGDNP